MWYISILFNISRSRILLVVGSKLIDLYDVVSFGIIITSAYFQIVKMQLNIVVKRITALCDNCFRACPLIRSQPGALWSLRCSISPYTSFSGKGFMRGVIWQGVLMKSSISWSLSSGSVVKVSARIFQT